MAVSMNFRSAFNGFNREDVVHYIEYISARHTAEVNQLNSEIEYLKGRQPASTEDETAPLQARIAELEAHCAELEAAQTDSTRVQELEARCAQLEAQLQQAQENCAQQPLPQQYSMEQELEAYRRAERTERLAQERAELIEQIANENAQRTEQLAKEYAVKIYTQANSALADATVKADTAAAEISTMVDTALEQLSQLQTAVTGSKQTLADAAASLYAIRTADHE